MQDKAFWNEVRRFTQARAEVYADMPRLYDAMKYIHVSVMEKCPRCHEKINQLSSVKCTKCGSPTTMMVAPNRDGTYVFEWNPYFTINLSPRELKGIIIHELLHVVLGHAAGRSPLSLIEKEARDGKINKIIEFDEKLKLWQMATDCAINSLIEDYLWNKNKTDHIGVLPSDIGLANGWNAEWYYHKFLEKANQNGLQDLLKALKALDSHENFGKGQSQGEGEGEGEGENGQGPVKKKKEYSLNESDEEDEGQGDPDENEEKKEEIKGDLGDIAEDLGLDEWDGTDAPDGPKKKQGAECGPGKGHPNASNCIKLDACGLKKVPKWKRSITRVSTHGFDVEEFSTRKRPNRRYGLIFPGRKRYNVDNKILVAVDVSGSISLELYKEFNKHLNHMLKHADFDVLFFNDTLLMRNGDHWYWRGDNDVWEPKKFLHKYKRDMSIPIGGGTNFEPVIQFWNKFRRGYNGLYVFTDGDAYYNSEPYEVEKVNWLIYGSGSRINHGKKHMMQVP